MTGLSQSADLPPEQPTLLDEGLVPPVSLTVTTESEADSPFGKGSVHLPVHSLVAERSNSVKTSTLSNVRV